MNPVIPHTVGNKLLWTGVAIYLAGPLVSLGALTAPLAAILAIIGVALYWFDR